MAYRDGRSNRPAPPTVHATHRWAGFPCGRYRPGLELSRTAYRSAAVDVLPSHPSPNRTGREGQLEPRTLPLRSARDIDRPINSETGFEDTADREPCQRAGGPGCTSRRHPGLPWARVPFSSSKAQSVAGSRARHGTQPGIGIIQPGIRYCRALTGPIRRHLGRCYKASGLVRPYSDRACPCCSRLTG